MFSVLKDEKGQYSTPRTLLFIYTGFVIHISLWNPAVLTPDMFTFLGLVFSLMTGWAGGARLAQYLFPNLNSLFSRFGAGKAGDAEIPEPTTSTDVQELSQAQKG